MKKILKDKRVYYIIGFAILLSLAIWCIALMVPRGSSLTCQTYGKNYKYIESKSCKEGCIPMTGTGDSGLLTCCCPSEE